jgi:nitronate monooxygenase
MATESAAGNAAAAPWIGRLRLPVIAAPMFLLSGPDLVIAAARVGIVGAFPTLNARTPEILEGWLAQITGALAGDEGGGTWAANVIAHRSNPRLDRDVDLLLRYRPPLVISALGSPRRIVERVHGYGGQVYADVNSIAFARKAAAGTPAT